MVLVWSQFIYRNLGFGTLTSYHQTAFWVVLESYRTHPKDVRTTGREPTCPCHHCLPCNDLAIVILPPHGPTPWRPCALVWADCWRNAQRLFGSSQLSGPRPPHVRQQEFDAAYKRAEKEHYREQRRTPRMWEHQSDVAHK